MKTRKAGGMAHWRALPENQNPLAVMTPIPYKATGSTYGACGVRIDGSPEFIDAVLSRLKPLLAGENQVTRLGFSRSEVDGSKLGKTFGNAASRAGKPAEVCYIRLHIRGREGAMAAAAFGEMREETREFAAALGVDPDKIDA